MSVIGYKGFDKNLKCRGMQFEVGKIYETEGNPKTKRNGMHFCLEPFGVFSHYPKKRGNRYCIVEALGQLSTDSHLDTKASTNKLRIVKEISEDELYIIQKKYRDEIDIKIRRGIDEFQRADRKKQ